MIRSFDIVKKLEEKLHTGYSLSIFRGYKAINKRGVEKIIDELYQNLPSDIVQAREYLKNKSIESELNLNSNESLYESIKNLEIEFDNGFSIAQYVIVNVRAIENIIDSVYKNMPKELIKAKNMGK